MLDERLLHDLAPQVLGAVVRRFHDFAAAEDAVREALLAAAQQWPREGVPDNPRAWLMQVASRRMIDEIRREIARRQREAEAAPAEAAKAAPHDERDDTLVLLTIWWTCITPSPSQWCMVRRKGWSCSRPLEARLKGHHRLDAVRAHLLEMAVDHEGAITHYRAAATRTTSIPERDYLMGRAARTRARTSVGSG